MSIRQKLFEAGTGDYPPKTKNDGMVDELRGLPKYVERGYGGGGDQPVVWHTDSNLTDVQKGTGPHALGGSTTGSSDSFYQKAVNLAKNPWYAAGGGALAATAAGLGGLALSRHLRKKKRDSEKKDK